MRGPLPALPARRDPKGVPTTLRDVAAEVRRRVTEKGGDAGLAAAAVLELEAYARTVRSRVRIAPDSSIDDQALLHR